MLLHTLTILQNVQSLSIQEKVCMLRELERTVLSIKGFTVIREHDKKILSLLVVYQTYEPFQRL